MSASTPSSSRDFADFVAASAPQLLGLAHVLTADPHDAWDLTQETLARVGERWDRSRVEQPMAYSRTVMVRLNVDRLRRMRRELPLVGTPHEKVTTSGDEGPEPWLLEALGTLSPRQRTAVALRFVEDLDVRGIAERMGCAEGTAKSHLSRGMERLRAHARDHAPAGRSRSTTKE
jgi:RNA polymerase sigma-70 factor (sigma-E family)